MVARHNHKKPFAISGPTSTVHARGMAEALTAARELVGAPSNTRENALRRVYGVVILPITDETARKAGI